MAILEQRDRTMATPLEFTGTVLRSHVLSPHLEDRILLMQISITLSPDTICPCTFPGYCRCCSLSARPSSLPQHPAPRTSSI
jgi:hypothetical protein